MSDDLVERARHNANADIPHHASVSLIEEMADRIEELEADLRRMALDYLAADGQAAEAYQGQLAAEDRIKELEAKLKEAVEAAYQLASDVIPCACHDCIEARTTLAELKGQEDE